MTTNEVIDACGRAPSGSQVVVRMMQHTATFALAGITLEYEDEAWRVVAEVDMTERRA